MSQGPLPPAFPESLVVLGPESLELPLEAASPLETSPPELPLEPAPPDPERLARVLDPLLPLVPVLLEPALDPEPPDPVLPASPLEPGLPSLPEAEPVLVPDVLASGEAPPESSPAEPQAQQVTAAAATAIAVRARMKIPSFPDAFQWVRIVDTFHCARKFH